MKASQLISILQKEMKKHGDILVLMYVELDGVFLEINYVLKCKAGDETVLSLQTDLSM